MKRKDFLIKTALAGVGLSGLTGVYSYAIEPFWVEFTHVDLPVSNLPDALEGKKMIQISDVHVGNRFDYSYIIESFIKVKALNPHFVVYTGDYISYENNTQFDQLAEVFEHAPLGSLGTVGVLGNHDYGVNWREEHVAERTVQRLKDHGITILRNEPLTLAGLTFIGLDDYWAINFDPVAAFKEYDPGRANIVLSHNPDTCDLDIWSGYKGWILSGHTHGGQCKPPFLSPPILPVRNKRYTAGIIELPGDRQVYINRALGHLWQVRFNVRPEITVFNLTKR
ncbi:MAG: metallophosphoesterase [Bacteroidota bacterium]